MENNYLTLGQLSYYDLELGTCSSKAACDQVIEKWRKVSVEQDDRKAKFCSNNSSQCKQIYASVLNQSKDFKTEINEFSRISVYDKAVFIAQQMKADS